MSETAKLIYDVDEKFKLESRKWQGAPSVEKTGKRLWAAWFSGGKYEPFPDNYGIIAYSDDDGKTWVEPYMILACDITENRRVFEVQLWNDDLDRLWLFWGQDMFKAGANPDYNSTNEELDEMFFGEQEIWAIYSENPDDETPVWSEPIHIGTGILRNNPTVTEDGTWLIPAYSIHNTTHYQYIISKDKGKTFETKIDAEKIGEKAYDEIIFVEKENKDLWLLARTVTGYIAESYSTDLGKTWSKTVNTDIPNPSTRFYMGRLKSGEMLLVNTPSNVLGDRKSIVASISEDDGKTWKYNLLLDDRRSTSYPDVAEGDDGSIYIIYDCQRDNRQEVDENDPMISHAAKEICLAKITVDDIKSGRLKNEGSYVKTISKVNYSSRALG